MKNAPSSSRLWEIDALRGIAIFLMILYHLFYDLSFFNLLDININSGIFLLIGRTASVLFIFIVGLSLTLSYHRSAQLYKPKPYYFSKYLKRGMIIFTWGMLITFVTWLTFPSSTIVFGILHFIGVSIILAYPFIKYKLPNLVGGIVCLFLSIFIENISVQNNYFVWLGLTSADFNTFDYFPLLPWFGVVMFGLFAGNVLYTGYMRLYSINDISKSLPVYLLQYLGKKSLAVYLLHQPVILLLLYILKLINFNDLQL